MVKILVLAGNIEQFNHYVAEHKNTGCDYRYVYGLHSVYGAYFDTYVICGTFWQRKDAELLFNEACKRDAIFMEMRHHSMKYYSRRRRLRKLFWVLLLYALILLVWSLFV